MALFVSSTAQNSLENKARSCSAAIVEWLRRLPGKLLYAARHFVFDSIELVSSRLASSATSY